MQGWSCTTWSPDGLGNVGTDSLPQRERLLQRQRGEEKVEEGLQEVQQAASASPQHATSTCFYSFIIL